MTQPRVKADSRVHRWHYEREPQRLTERLRWMRLWEPVVVPPTAVEPTEPPVDSANMPVDSKPRCRCDGDPHPWQVAPSRPSLGDGVAPDEVGSDASIWSYIFEIEFLSIIRLCIVYISIPSILVPRLDLGFREGQGVGYVASVGDAQVLLASEFPLEVGELSVSERGASSTGFSTATATWSTSCGKTGFSTAV